MEDTKSILYEDLNLSIGFGHYEIRIVHIGYLLPDPGWLIRKHDHHCFELHYIPSGSGTVSVGKDLYQVAASSCYIVGPHVIHEQHASSDDPMSEYGLNFEIIPKHRNVKPTVSDDGLQEQEKDLLVREFCRIDFWIGNGTPYFAHLFGLLRDELDHQFIGYYSNIECLLTSILILLMRSCTSMPRADYRIPQKNLNTKRQILIHNYLTSHYKDASKEELAGILSISVRQLSREIRALYPEGSFHKVLLAIRLDHARQLLEQTSETVENIALDTGFSSTAYFCSTFKNEYHLTPTDYRNTCLLYTSRCV